MTSIAPIERGNVPKRSYITTGPYSTDIYNYARTYNASTYTWSGALTSFSADNTPMGSPSVNVAGVILRETGRKLYPDANPGVSTYMVGVYHPDIGTGFIDPNSPKFAVYNSDKPLYMDNGVDPNGSLVDQGQPVYTRGSITSSGPTAGIGYAAGAGATVTQASSLSTGVTINAACGSIVSYSVGGGGVTINGNTAAEFTVTNNVVDATDVIIVSAREIQNTALVVNVSEIGADYFKIAILNTTANNITLTSAPITINFAVIKAVVA